MDLCEFAQWALLSYISPRQYRERLYSLLMHSSPPRYWVPGQSSFCNFGGVHRGLGCLQCLYLGNLASDLLWIFLSKLNLFHVVSSACVPLPLHLTLAENQAGVPSGQQGVGVSEVSRTNNKYHLFSPYSSDTWTVIHFSSHSLWRFSSALLQQIWTLAVPFSHQLFFRPFSACLLHYGPSQCIIPFLFYIYVTNLDCFVCCKYLNKKKKCSHGLNLVNVVNMM